MSSVKKLDKLLADGRKFWEECECTTSFASPNYYMQVTKVLERLCKVILTPEMTVADIGCGNGRFTKLIAAYSGRITGYELSEKLIGIANAAYPLENGSYMKLDLEDDMWTINEEHNTVFLMGVLQTLHNHRTAKQAIAKIRQALCDGGILVTRESLAKGKSFMRACEAGYYALYRSRPHHMKLFQGFTLEREILLRESPELQNSFFIFRKAVS